MLRIGVFRENIKIALGSIRTQLLRTILTIVIIAIGITALVGILTVVTAIDYNLTSSFASMGSNTFNINQYKNTLRGDGGNEIEKINPIITYSEARAFKEKYNFPATQTSLSFIATSNAEVKYENQKTDPEISVLGIDEYYLTNSGLEVTQGRNFNVFDISNNVYSCIVGSDFATKGLLKDINPIGKTLSIRGAKFKVIGVLKEKGSTFGNSRDLRVMIPIQVARSLFSQPNINYSLSTMIQKAELLDAAIDNAIITMRQIRKLNPVEEDNFGISRSDDLLNRIASITDVLGASAWIMGIITILGSSIALMKFLEMNLTLNTILL
jgi:putative ABC transport system permease protein